MRIFIFICFIFFCSCKQEQTSNNKSEASPTESTTEVNQDFVSIPDSLLTKRKDYIKQIDDLALNDEEWVSLVEKRKTLNEKISAGENPSEKALLKKQLKKLNQSIRQKNVDLGIIKLRKKLNGVNGQIRKIISREKKALNKLIAPLPDTSEQKKLYQAKKVALNKQLKIYK